MTHTRIKICGIGRVEDALSASLAGADAIGMVFHPESARCVTVERAREILSALPPFVTPVALFVDAEASLVQQIARALGLRHVQLHGHEMPETVRQLAEFVVLKALRVDRATFKSDLNAWRAAIKRDDLTNLRGMILETPSAAPGGTGLLNDWQFVRECQTEGLFEGLPPIIAAGGLTPENVAAVVRDIRPWAVDVSSGVESTKGIKSEEKIVGFIRAVNKAEG